MLGIASITHGKDESLARVRGTLGVPERTVRAEFHLKEKGVFRVAVFTHADEDAGRYPLTGVWMKIDQHSHVHRCSVTCPLHLKLLSQGVVLLDKALTRKPFVEDRVRMERLEIFIEHLDLNQD